MWGFPFAVGGRSVVENVLRTSFSLFDALLEDMILVPELLNFLFSGDEIHVCGYFLVHADFFLSAEGPAQ